MKRPDRSTGFYAPALDGLRCIAVSTVMIAHFSPTLGQRGDWGNIGVRLFFVLSGFLITMILLRTRTSCDLGDITRFRALKGFFARRAVRLWPVYFLTLAVAYVLHVPGTGMSIGWHACFLTNHYIFHTQSWPLLLSHYWTLAVEQQFYVFWPVFILSIPAPALPTLFATVAICGPISRFVLIALNMTAPEFDGVLLPCCLDFFALGGFVAWAKCRPALPGYAVWLGSGVVSLALLMWIAFGVVLKTTGTRLAFWPVWDGSIQAVGFAGLLLFVLRAPRQLWCKLLQHPILVYLGQISYGLYIYHNFMHRLGPSILRRLTGQNYFQTEWAHVLFLVALTVLISVASYHLLEIPLRQLGRRWT